MSKGERDSSVSNLLEKVLTVGYVSKLDEKSHSVLAKVYDSIYAGLVKICDHTVVMVKFNKINYF